MVPVVGCGVRRGHGGVLWFGLAGTNPSAGARKRVLVSKWKIIAKVVGTSSELFHERRPLGGELLVGKAGRSGEGQPASGAGRLGSGAVDGLDNWCRQEPNVALAIADLDCVHGEPGTPRHLSYPTITGVLIPRGVDKSATQSRERVSLPPGSAKEM